MTRQLTIQQRQQARKMRREGKSVRETAVAIGCSLRTVKRLTRGHGRRESEPIIWSPGAGHLSLSEREEISRGLSAGDSLRAIACRLRRSPSTVSREVAANGCRAQYRAVKAHHVAYDRSRRPKKAKFVAGALLAIVETWLEQLWSPQEIARRLRLEYPGDPAMWVSHETIYASLFVQVRISLKWPRQSARNGQPGSGFWPPPRRSRQRPTRGVRVIP